MSERIRRVDVFGGTVSLHASGEAADLTICAALLRAMHDTFTRFDAGSELSRLNADPRSTVPASRLMCRLAALVPYAGKLSDGLVDATTIDALEEAGYVSSLRHRERYPQPAPGGPGRPALADPRRRWSSVSVDPDAGTVTRPRGVRIDGGGLVKGMAADVLAARLSDHDAFAVSCLGDVRIGGRAGQLRPIEIADPFGGATPVATLPLTAGAVATSGTTSRSFTGTDGRPAHHLIDPGRGEPAWTGIVQASAVAPTAVEAEVRAKAALLAGPAGAERFLVHGGVLVLAGGEVVEITADACAVAA